MRTDTPVSVKLEDYTHYPFEIERVDMHFDLEPSATMVKTRMQVTPLKGGGEMVLYTTAKTALSGFTRAQALEWAPHGIHVNCIAPGLFPDVVTGGPERVSRTEERAKREVPLGRTGQLKEVGYLALYLASAASDYMTGQTLILDGGRSL